MAFVRRLGYTCGMTTINAHFDGKVIVPDAPLPLSPGEKLRVTIERESAPELQTQRRKAGSARGQVWMSPNFDAPLPEFEDLE